MKVKTSITLSSDVLDELDAQLQPGDSRSAVIETALVAYFLAKRRERRERRDLELINAHADELNAEAGEVLDYQVEP